MINKTNPNYQLKRHIELVHSKVGQYKTILETSDIYYIVVTKVNFSTTKLWVEYINSIIKNNPKARVDSITKINWLVLLKSYRKDFQKNLIEKINKVEIEKQNGK